MTFLFAAVLMLTLTRLMALSVVTLSRDRIRMSPLLAPPRVLFAAPAWKSTPTPVVGLLPPVPSSVIRPPVLETTPPATLLSYTCTPKLLMPEPLPTPISVMSPLVVAMVALPIRIPVCPLLLLLADVPVIFSVPPLADTRAPVSKCAPTVGLPPAPVAVPVMSILPKPEVIVVPAPTTHTPWSAPVPAPPVPVMLIPPAPGAILVEVMSALSKM